MTSYPKRLGWRRRGFVITIAVVVVGLGWWYWPRNVWPWPNVHSLIVGKWYGGGLVSEYGPRNHEIELEFLKDRTGFETRSGFKRVPFMWSVDRQTVDIDFETVSKPPGALLVFGKFRYLVSKIDRERLVWTLVAQNGRSVDDDAIETLERVP